MATVKQNPVNGKKRWPGPRELLEIGKVVKGALKLRPKPDDHVTSMGLHVEKTAARYPDRTMCLFEGRTLTWKEFNQLCNRYAAVFRDQGVSSGDCVGLMMENRPEFMASVIGLGKLGAVAALLNTNLREEQLVHSLKTTGASQVIVGAELTDRILDIKDDADLGNISRYLFVADGDLRDAPDWCIDLTEPLNRASVENPPETQKVTLGQHAIYIFTSGTTGMPKAAVIRQSRWNYMAYAFSGVILRMKPKDRMYLCLPLYHSNAIYAGMGAVIVSGASMVLRRKFSASKFLHEVREYQATCFTYIGELCRYLMHTPARPDDGDNPLVKCTGNGLRPDIWHDFKKRFNISRIGEFYGSSEGNAGFINGLNKDCTVGFSVSPHALIEYDILNDEIIRGGDGHCRRVKGDQPGLLVTQITDSARFDGYTDPDATEKKVLRDVFEKGDAWVNTGDLLCRVDVGPRFLPHYQFVDRTGDTFRWKGENVSTTEVCEVINQFDEVEYSNVYGVQMPGTDGRAGMVAVKPRGKEMDMEKFARFVDQHLPGYSQPIFVRMIREMDTTSTFKLKKGDLRDQAFHPERCGEQVWVRKPGGSTYETLDPAFYDHVMRGDAGF